MFKLKKIFNSGVNVPEPERCTVSLTEAVKAGTPLIESAGILHIGSQDMTPTHITVEDVKQGYGYALCYRISPDMLFEAEICSDEVALISKGLRIALYDEGNGFNKLSDNVLEEGGAFVYDMNNATEYGDHLYVCFK